jgi:hypothetical protein
MNATRERPRGRYGPAWDGASLFPHRAGVPWWAAVLIAVGLSSTGAFADLQRISRLGLIFQGCYLLGCLLAIVLVERKALFGPMVQPPLILAVTVPGVVLLASGAPSGGGLPARALSVATPLINGFPTMAITTLLAVAVGVFRLLTQRRPAGTRQRTQRSTRPAADRPAQRRAANRRRPASDGSDPEPPHPAPR